jgi:hypothetical protein
MKTRLITYHGFKQCLFGTALVATFLACQTVSATTGIWKTAAGGTWNTSGNWTGGIPQNAGDIAYLTNSLASGKGIGVNQTVVLGSMIVGCLNGANNGV